MGQPAIFLDRDGVIIENRQHYVRSWDDVEIFPQAISALVAAKHSAYRIVIVTNQSAVGRGIITLEAAEAINNRLLAVLHEAGARVDTVYMCPHAPDDGCSCRKPLPGLLLRAAEELDLDLSRSIMIGDALTDIRAGQVAGVGRSALVRTGRGREQERLWEATGRPAVPVFDSLNEALEILINPVP